MPSNHIEWTCTLGSEKCHQCNMDTHAELFICAICRGAEGSLPTDCPKRAMSETEKDKIYLGTLDYRNGEWTTIKAHT